MQGQTRQPGLIPGFWITRRRCWDQCSLRLRLVSADGRGRLATGGRSEVEPGLSRRSGSRQGEDYLTDLSASEFRSHLGEAVHTHLGQAVIRAVDRYQLFSTGDRVLAGVSGGPDSMALILSLMGIADTWGLELGIAHINHGLRGEAADLDEAFVREFAACHGIRFHGCRTDVAGLAAGRKLSMETAGRQARYDFFKETTGRFGYTRVALGHTRDDNAEGVLMNLIRGSGPKGLSGIPARRDGWIVRPLILASRAEVLAFLDGLGQSYRVDASNNDPRYTRNRIRNRLIPLIETEFNPNLVEGLNRLAGIMQQEDEWLDQEASRLLEQAVVCRDERSICLKLCAYQKLCVAAAHRVARKAIEAVKGDLRRIARSHTDAVVGLAFDGGSGRSLDLPGRVRVFRDRSGLWFRRERLPLRQIGKQRKRAASGK